MNLQMLSRRDLLKLGAEDYVPKPVDNDEIRLVVRRALRRFKRKCEKSGILSELKKRQHYEKPSVKRKKKALAAKKRAMKKSRKSY